MNVEESHVLPRKLERQRTQPAWSVASLPAAQPHHSRWGYAAAVALIPNCNSSRKAEELLALVFSVSCTGKIPSPEFILGDILTTEH